MLKFSKCVVVSAVLIACAPICLANLVDELDKEEAHLVEKYGRLLEKSSVPTSAEEKELFSKYVELNEQLETELPDSDDVAANIEAASKLGGNAKSSFVLLGQLTGDWQHNKKLCSSYSEKILRLNLNVALELGSNARVSNVIRKVSEHHAQACQNVYALKYHQNLGQLDESERAKLFGLFNDLDVAGWMANQPTFLVNIMLGNEPGVDLGSEWKQWLAKRVFQGLKRAVASSEELNFMEGLGDSPIDGRKFEVAYEQLVRHPCGKFVELEADVFGPATMDLGVSRAPLLKGELSAEEIQFAFGFFRYETCKTVLGAQGNAFESTVKEAINY